MNDFQFSKFNHGLKQLLTCNGASSLSTADNQLLALRKSTVADLGTLPQAAWISHQYLKLNHGDLVLLNDPYSGNSHLQSMTIIAGLTNPLKNITSKNIKTNFLISHRFWFKPRVIPSLHIEEEGVRIPPTPLYHQGQFNKQLLNGVSAHPLCPPHFSQRVQEVANEISEHINTIKPLFKNFEITEPNIRAYLRESKKRFLELLDTFPENEVQMEHQFPDNSILKIQIRFAKEKFVFDFSGTTESTLFATTDGATLSACLFSLYQTLPSSTPLNAGCLKVIEVITPTKSMVNSRYPNPVFLGLTDGINWISQLVTQGLQKLAPSIGLHAESSTTEASFEIFFKNGSIFYDNVIAGSGASNSFPGLSGHSTWSRTDLNPCIEKIEQLYPIRFQSISERERSGGQGLFSGGNGVSKFFKILEEGTFRSIFFESSLRPQGANGGQAGASLEMFVIRDGNKIPIKELSQFALIKGDTLAIHSSGGGGYGRNPS